MKEEIKDILELFVEKADKLTEEEFTEFMQEYGHKVSYQYLADPQQLTVSTVAPSQTMTNSFLLTYRMFVQGNEHMRFIDPTRLISNELLDTSLSQQWLEQVQDVAQKIHTFLCEKPTIPMVINLVDLNGNTQTETLTRWDILDTLLYGEFAHSTQRKRLKNWLSTPFKEMVWEFLMMEFRNILAVTLKGIKHLAHYAQIELTLL